MPFDAVGSLLPSALNETAPMNLRILHRVFSLASSVILLLTISGSVLAQTNHPVDLNQFQGVWHEVARSPNLFQRNCQSSTAEYRLRADGRIQVINRCTTSDGGCRTIQGTACSTNAPCNNQLIVSLDAPFARRAERRGRVNYQIHYVSPDYQTAVVGTPRGRNVWVLSRASQIAPQQLSYLKSIARNAGYRTDNLIAR